jgi:hypothetical protein
MDALWITADSPVAGGAVSRTWLWGAGPLRHAYEEYDEAQHGFRLVYYFDKTAWRSPTARRPLVWYVTNGLVARDDPAGCTGGQHFRAARPRQRGRRSDDTVGPRYPPSPVHRTPRPSLKAR